MTSARLAPVGQAPDSLCSNYDSVRGLTERLCESLTAEDMNIQSMPEASPAKWHLAHTTWFFETFLLAPQPGYQVFHPRFAYLFNSYYNSLGERVPRPQRGLLSRPTAGEVLRYRAHVDAHLRDLLGRLPGAAEVGLVRLGLNHEQQHQELLLTDVKHAFAANPLRPAYREGAASLDLPVPPLQWLEFPEGLRWLGHAGPGFAYDNEGPRHRAFVGGFCLAARLVSSGEFQAFIDAGGYERPEWWLSDGWDARRRLGWAAPLYWEKIEGQWWSLTLNGFHPVRASDPVLHVSYYEADAFARWAGARLPTEAEWETAAGSVPLAGSFLDAGRLHPTAAGTGPIEQLFGEAWQWTSSPYTAYPGYRPPEGALGEYNGKFMCNQLVLRGGSCLTPRSHFRASYRNFFPPDARWQFTGIRLARDP
jgi:ergothioneine biosynthesis protein EgtB